MFSKMKYRRRRFQVGGLRVMKEIFQLSIHVPKQNVDVACGPNPLFPVKKKARPASSAVEKNGSFLLTTVIEENFKLLILTQFHRMSMA